MRRLLATTVVILAGSALLLVPVWVLHLSVLRVERMASVALRPLATLGVLALGAAAFLAGTWVATHLAVRLFHDPNAGSQSPVVSLQ